MRLLRVTAEAEAEVTAHAARLHLVIEGETFVMGNAALERAREVRELVSALRAAGLTAADLQVMGVSLASTSGLLTKNQRAQYALSAQATPDQLPAVLGAVAAQRSAKLSRLEWLYDEFEASIPLAAQAMRRARQKADAIAEAAGHSVTGVHNASDSWDMPVANVNLLRDEAPAALYARARDAAPVDLGVEFRASQTLHVHLTVDFTLE